MDDVRESPALQLIAAQSGRGGAAFRAYDPFLNKAITPGQMLDFDAFLEAVDLVVILVNHQHILEQMDRLKDKTVLDCRNVCPHAGTYRL